MIDNLSESHFANINAYEYRAIQIASHGQLTRILIAYSLEFRRQRRKGMPVACSRAGFETEAFTKRKRPLVFPAAFRLSCYERALPHRHTLPDLFGDFGHNAGADGAAAFADRKAQAVFHRDGAISSTLNFRLSPGITISVPSGS